MAQNVSGSARSVGSAYVCNPVPIINPCRRVVATNGRLGGYSGGTGLETKRTLIAHEGAVHHSPATPGDKPVQAALL